MCSHRCWSWRGIQLGKLGHVAIDSTRMAANASRDRVDTCKRCGMSEHDSPRYPPLAETMQ